MRSSSKRASSIHLDALVRVATFALCAATWCGCAVEPSAGENAESSSAALSPLPKTNLGTPSHAPICETLATCDGFATVRCGGVQELPPYQSTMAPLYIASTNGAAPFPDWTAANSVDKTSFNWSEPPAPAHAESFTVCASASGGAKCAFYTVNFPAPGCSGAPKNCSVQNPAPGCIGGGGGGGLIR